MLNNTAMAKRLATLPNYLSAFRIVILPFLGYTISAGWAMEACYLLALAGLSDFLDGWFARRRREESDVGKLMDTVADKVLLCVAIIFLVADSRQPLNPWLGSLLLAREFLITGLRSMLASSGIVMGAAMAGKIKMTAQFFGLGCFILGQLPWGGYFRIAGLALLWISAGLSYYSMAQYTRRAYLELRAKIR